MSRPASPLQCDSSHDKRVFTLGEVEGGRTWKLPFRTHLHSPRLPPGWTSATRRSSSSVAADGEKRSDSTIPCTSKALERWASAFDGQRVVLEVGPHSRWVSRLLLGHRFEVVVANPRRVKLISQNDSKTDLVDAELLARLGRVDPSLLSPITHRSEDLARDMVVLRARAALVKTRTLLVNSVRDQVKATGSRLPSKSAATFHLLYDALPGGGV